MNSAPVVPVDTGLEVSDAETDASFGARHLHRHDVVMQMEAMERLARSFVESPGTILQELVDAAVTLCGADSAGISIEREDATDENFYQWVATAGAYRGFLDAFLPKYPSACGICLQRGTPQHFRVTQPFFDVLGVDAPLVTDGLLLPWQVDETRGTIFIMAHARQEAFDSDDCRMMKVLADFAALGIRQRRQQALLLQQAAATAAAAMANDLAHKINNPLQSLANILFLAAEGHNGEDARAVGQYASADLQKLSSLVQQLLALPYQKQA